MKIVKRLNAIIWDWNGTLLNDLDFCISIINKVLAERALTPITKNSYKAVFSFPVIEYYKAIGFDFEKEDFEIPAREFIDLYNAGVKNCQLHPAAVETLTYFQAKGIRQFVLSAMQEDMLIQTLKQQNIFHFFEGVAGLNNHYAHSKVERGQEFISVCNIDKNHAILIGDTLHDYEVASQLGCNCILIADGHQSEERLKSAGVPVLSSLGELRQLDF